MPRRATRTGKHNCPGKDGKFETKCKFAYTETRAKYCKEHQRTCTEHPDWFHLKTESCKPCDQIIEAQMRRDHEKEKTSSKKATDWDEYYEQNANWTRPRKDGKKRKDERFELETTYGK